MRLACWQSAKAFASRGLSCRRELEIAANILKIAFGVTPKATRGTRALPGTGGRKTLTNSARYRVKTQLGACDYE